MNLFRPLLGVIAAMILVLVVACGEEGSTEQAESSGPELREIIGEWNDEIPSAPDAGNIITFVREGDGVKMERRFNDGTQLSIDLAETTVEGKVRYEDRTSGEGKDYYLINDQGQLESYDDLGLIRVAEKLP